MKIIIAGSTGFIGKELVTAFRLGGHQVIRLIREPSDEKDCAYWDPYKQKIDLQHFEQCDVVINLAGENVLGKWTQEKMRAIYDSRISAARFLAKSLQNVPPKIFIQASATGFYGNRGEEILTEESAPGDDFLAKVCQDWEKEAEILCAQSRVAHARFGIVLSPNGGALKTILPSFKMGLGGKLGTGDQYVSWVAIEDLIKAIEFIIQTNSIKGPINIVSPSPITNKEFTKAIGESLHRPTFFSMPEALLSTLFGEGAQFFLASTRVIPKKLIDHGFRFLYPDIQSALHHYLIVKKN